jgi:hypothetical protein
MYHREFPIQPSQSAINGALCIYLEGSKRDDARQMLFGLSVLRHATEKQIDDALPSVRKSQGLSGAEVHALLAG